MRGGLKGNTRPQRVGLERLRQVKGQAYGCELPGQTRAQKQQDASGVIQTRQRTFPLCAFSSVGKESACNAGDPSWIPGSERSTGEGIGYPLQYSWASLVAQLVKNPPAVPDPGSIPGVWKIPWRRDRLPTPVFSGFPCGSAVKNLPAMLETWVRSLGREYPLEKGKATHSRILAWRIPWTVQSMGSQRVEHD